MTKTIKGIAAPLPLANVDTDVIMPKRFLITITREGLGDGAFADLRFDNAGQKRPEADEVGGSDAAKRRMSA